MKKRVAVLSYIILLLTLTSSVIAKPINDTTEVLLIGSSYFNYNNLKKLVQGLADSSGKALYIEMCGQNGLYLADHANSPSTEAKINERDWDYVILQGVGVLVAYPNHFTDHPVYPALETLQEKIESNCSTTHMVFCLPWAFEDGMTWYQNWTDTYEDMQWHIYDTTLLYANDLDIEIAPVGWAWYGILQLLNYPLHYLHMSDWNHPSLQGSYLMACVIYSNIFLESTVNNTYLGGLSYEEASMFQAAASDTVLQNLELWNINTSVSVDEYKMGRSSFRLDQNFPNPFTSSTTIPYYLNEDQEVSISIINSKGEIIVDMARQFQSNGHHSLHIDTQGFMPGLYSCIISSNNASQSIRMIHIE